MDKYIIAWVPLAWKSTLAHHLQKKYWINHIPTDWFISAFQETFPEVGISHSFWLSIQWYNKVCEKSTDFLISFISELDDQNKFWWYVIEWCHWNIKKLNHLKKSHRIIVLGYPSISTEKKFSIVREKDINNWTNEVGDKELKDIINFWIQISVNLKEQCLEHWFDFVDSWKDFDEIFNSDI